MNAEKFKEQIDTNLYSLIKKVDFERVGNSFVREDNTSQLILLRFNGSKFASLNQFTRVTLCFRHKFLRDIWEKFPTSHPREISSYPFRIKPTELGKIDVGKWKYNFELNCNEYDEIRYGESDNVSELLKEIGTLTITNGIRWAETLTPKQSLIHLEKNSSGTFVDKMWIEDYQNYLKDR
ncbi:MAG TPA: hypothetical protein PKE69_05620 [Pyrinomonadaceae bacterium]|nr:hypothetical protein [Pyrinomonadaceae bacterium]